MQTIDKRQGLMLCAVGILILVMITVFVRLMTAKVLVNRIHMDNIVTQTILYGNVNLQGSEQQKATANNIVWARAYPFSDIDAGNKMRSLPIEKIESKAVNLEKKVGEWTGKNLLGYYKLAEAGREYEVGIGWKLISPVQEIAPLGDGVWSFVYPKADIRDKVLSLTDLAQAVEVNGAKFLYVQAPFKVDPYGDFAINGRFDFTNENCDALLTQLAANGVDTLDLRENLHQWAYAEHVSYHDFFFRTDHHWKPETALRAAKVVGEKLLSYGITFDSSYYDLQDYDVEILPAYFLGSEGKRATLAKVQADDFSILHPKFPTEMKVDIPEKKIDRTGDFELLLYDKNCVENKDLYNMNPYSMYGHGDMAIMNMENLLMPTTNKKVLLIRDSYCDTMAPFLALGVRNLMTVDLRHFTGSVKAYIAEQKPDVVIVMYTGSIHDAINWTSHKDKFDFR